MRFLQLQSAEGDIQLQHGASQLADALAKVLELASQKDLYQRHVVALIPLVTAAHEDWSGASPAKSLFQTFMKNSGNAVRTRDIILLCLTLTNLLRCEGFYFESPECQFVLC